MDPRSEAPSRKTILVADDETALLALIRNTLEAAGFTVHTAESGDRALALGRELGAELDLLLVDVVLPGVSGPELAAQLVAELPELEVIYTSGYGAGAGKALHQRDSEAVFLPKPFTPKELVALVREHLD
jgi:DNA-binding NtrC family response regulator